jgi:glycosyltransferase involved in cell wall biosynthesis
MADDVPSISVCMPVYNAERFVAEAVESILNQTLGDFEFLIVDDGSTDGSRRILEGYAARDPRIRLVSRPNTGLVIALNEMLAAARGAFIPRTDADDVAMPERFERQASYLRAHPEVLALGTRVLVIDPEGAPLTEMCEQQSHEEIDRAQLGGLVVICHPTVMARAEVLRRVGGYRPETFPAEDLDLWLRLAEIGRLANLPEALVKYRQHLQSIGNAQRVRQEAATGRVVADARRRRGLSRDEPAAAPAPASPRPDPGGLDHMRKWAWWALASGYVSTARGYAIRCWCRRPFSLESWRLLYCALRGH